MKNTAEHFEGRAFGRLEVAGSKRIAEAVVATTVEEQVAAIDGHRPIRCECGCPSVGEHNRSAMRLNGAATGRVYA